MSRRLAGACLLGLALAAGGCGEDEEAPRPAQERTVSTPEATTTAETESSSTEADKAPTGDGHGGGQERPEQQQGGAGDEVPARSQAQLTGQGGRISPRLVRVPPFIAVRVELRSADGLAYGLRFGRATVRAGRGVASSSTTLDGLRPGAAYTGRPLGGGSAVRIEASAEPGP